MSERLETLKKARERMIEDRDAHAKVLAAPFDLDRPRRIQLMRSYSPPKGAQLALPIEPRRQ